jgi:hypothetical protein
VTAHGVHSPRLYVHAWLSAFVFTQLIEAPIYLRAQVRDGEPAGWVRRLGLGLLASAITHPCVWFVIPRIFYSETYDALAYRFPALLDHRYTLFFLVAETFAVVAEALLLRAFGLRRAFLWALLANATSAGLGYIARHYTGWP